MSMISVIMPVYNGAKYVREAIESILAQTDKEIELIIVDDGSTDESAQIISSFKDERIKFFKKKHEGLVQALNFGISVSQGKYIARLDSDDIAQPSRLEVQKKFLDQNNHIAICGSWATLIDDNGEVVGSLIYPPEGPEAISRYILLHNPFVHPSVMIRREVLIQCGGYRAWFRHVEDYELWTRILSKNKGANIPQNLIKYRVHRKQITSSKNIEMRLRGLVVRILALLRLYAIP